MDPLAYHPTGTKLTRTGRTRARPARVTDGSNDTPAGGPQTRPAPPTGGRTALDLPFLVLAKEQPDRHGLPNSRKKTLPGSVPTGTVTGLVVPPG